jgi:integrase
MKAQLKASPVDRRGKREWVVALGKKQVGRRVRIFGATKDEAIARAQEKLDELRDHGFSLSDISASHRGLILEWRDKLTVDQMADAFRRFAAVNPTARIVEKAVAEYLATRKASFSRQHAASTKTRLKRFEASFAGKAQDVLNPGEIDSFIVRQGASADNYYRALRAFFAHARRHRWSLVDPMVEIPRPASGISGEKTIFTPAQMKALLGAAAGIGENGERHEPTLALFVLGGLCGLRYSEALRLDWKQVDLGVGEIHLDKLKTSKRGLRGRFVRILPAAAAWLATLSPANAGRVVKNNDKNARRQRARVLAAAKLKEWPDNALRRSWGSYHLAAYENADLTAAQMGHVSGDTTIAKYRTLARKAEGEAWFALTPMEVEK